MIETIERLSRGESRVVDDFVKARKFWTEFFGIHRDASVKELADALGHAQSQFETLLD